MFFLLSKLRASLNDLPVSRKILAITTISSLATLTALCSISFYREWGAFSDRKINEITTFAHILEQNAIAPLRFSDQYRANEYVDSLQNQADIVSATILDKQGNVFAQYANQELFTGLPKEDFIGELWKENRLYFARSIMLDGQLRGRAIIEMDTISYQESIKRSLWTMIALWLGGLAITMILAARLQKLITVPVKELVDVTQSVAKGKDYSERATKRHSDEIGILVESFNAMLDTIGERDETLRGINANLEKTVEERTEDLRKRNDALIEAMEAAKAASIAKSEFLATTSHELRTPLNPIIGYVEMLLREDPDGKNTEELGLIRQSAKQLLSLIEDILDFSRIERGNIELEISNFNFTNLCRDIVRIMNPESKQKGIELTFTQTQNASNQSKEILLGSDENKLRQVLFNLIGNAIKFTEHGKIELRTTTFSNTAGTPTVRVEVSDTGIGIATEDTKKLFKPFSQVDGSLTRQYGGLGLGLAISQKIVGKMGGKIVCRSEKGKGSTFSFELPIEISPVELNVDSETEPANPSYSKEHTILLVEDEPVNRELIRSLLSSLGHRVIAAKDGIEALEKSDGHDFSLVFMDISMPRLDGFDTAIAIRKRESLNSHAPIIAMTAHATPQSKERCFAVGMDDYLSKPLSFTKLRQTLEKWLNNAKSQNSA